MATHLIRVLDDHRLAVHDHGEGPTVVLLHGIPGSATSWAPVARRLAEDHRVIVPELLGFGASSRPSDAATLHAAGQAAALGAGLDELGIDRAVVAGHDFGGPTALLLHAAHPSRTAGLVLSATNAFTDTPIPFPIASVTWPVVGRLAARMLFSRPSLRLMVHQAVAARPSPVDVDAALGDRGQARAIRVIFATSLRELADRYAPVQATLADVGVPTTVVWGDRDPFFSIADGERLAAAIPGAAFRLLRGAGHFLPEERPDDLAAEIRRVAAQAPSSGSGRSSSAPCASASMTPTARS